MASITIDANALIALANGQDSHHDWAVEFFTSTIEDSLYISALTLAEVLVNPIRTKTAKKFLSDISDLGIEVVPISAEDALELAHVRATTALRMPDAVVLHTAMKQKSAIATTDLQLTRAAQKQKIKVQHP